MIEIVSESDLTAEQSKFAAHWIHKYFDHVEACQTHDKARVHWRMFLRDQGKLVSHLSLTELTIKLDDAEYQVGSIGSLFTVPDRMGEGLAGRLMKYAEDFLLQHSQFPIAMLFCLPDLVPFYELRSWRRVEVPVTLEQASGEILAWSEACMILQTDNEMPNFHRLHVPHLLSRGQGS